VIVLSLDTTTRAGSAALVDGRQIKYELTGDARLTHGERLPGELIRVLEGAGIALKDVDLLAVAAGPGSFTGLRVGIAAIQGLAVAIGRPIVPVSALDALAHAARDRGGRIAAWMDAQRGQVFACLYDDNGGVVVPASVLPPVETLAAWGREARGAEPARFIGDGAVRYADAIRSKLGEKTAILEPPPLAGIIGLIAAGSPDRAVSPHAVVPIYIRRPDAELARHQKASRS
jgi:tRNA threonylcarbamoyladenosine biosynthesis protein TsaB